MLETCLLQKVALRPKEDQQQKLNFGEFDNFEDTFGTEKPKKRRAIEDSDDTPPNKGANGQRSVPVPKTKEAAFFEDENRNSVPKKKNTNTAGNPYGMSSEYQELDFGDFNKYVGYVGYSAILKPGTKSGD